MQNNIVEFRDDKIFEILISYGIIEKYSNHHRPLNKLLNCVIIYIENIHYFHHVVKHNHLLSVALWDCPVGLIGREIGVC